jgi:hypothetical protein
LWALSSLYERTETYVWVESSAIYFDELPQEIDCGKRVTRSQTDELVTLAKQKRVRSDNKRAASLLHNGCESCVDFALGACIQEIVCIPTGRAAFCTSRASTAAVGNFGLISIATAVALAQAGEQGPTASSPFPQP